MMRRRGEASSSISSISQHLIPGTIFIPPPHPHHLKAARAYHVVYIPLVYYTPVYLLTTLVWFHNKSLKVSPKGNKHP